MVKIKKSKPELETLTFKSQQEWRLWLEKNYSIQTGIRIRFFKKATKIVSLNYDEALDEALCYGWIDGQSNSYDDTSWLQKFTPRRPKGTWSKRNREHVERLIKAGKMTPAGLKEIEAAKADGRWDIAYDSPSTMIIPEDFLKELSKNAKAQEFFKTLNKTDTYAIVWRLQTAKKPETRENRMKAILEKLSKGEKFH